jgi:hypothetical protein
MLEFAAWVESTADLENAVRDRRGSGRLVIAALHRPVHADRRRRAARPAVIGMFRGVPISPRQGDDAVGDRGISAQRRNRALFLIMQPHLYLSSGSGGRRSRSSWSRRPTRCSSRLAGAVRVVDGCRRRHAADVKVVGACSLVSWFAVLYCGRMLPYLGTGN